LSKSHEIHKKYKQKLEQIVTAAIVRIQRFLRPVARRLLLRKGFVLARLRLEVKKASRVQVFGEFTLKTPWTKKIDLTQSLSNNIWEALVCIRTGHQFKFCVEDGARYLVAADYEQQPDGFGGVNNIFRFHKRDSR
jgi:glutamate mutase epsilon subunit